MLPRKWNKKNKVQSIKIKLDVVRLSEKNSISGKCLRKNREISAVIKSLFEPECWGCEAGAAVSQIVHNLRLFNYLQHSKCNMSLNMKPYSDSSAAQKHDR